MDTRTSNELTAFFSKFSVMLANAVPIGVALEQLEADSNHDALDAAIQDLRRAVDARASLADAMEGHPALFSDQVIQLTRTGEAIGALDLVTRVIPELILFRNLAAWKSLDAPQGV